jgi:hypothetical protein
LGMNSGPVDGRGSDIVSYHRHDHNHENVSDPLLGTTRRMENVQSKCQFLPCVTYVSVHSCDNIPDQCF